MAEELNTFQADLPEDAGVDGARPVETSERFAGRKLPSLNRNSVMLGIMFLGGILGVYLVGMRVNPQMASAGDLIAEQEVENVLLQYHKGLNSTGNLRKRETAILNSFYYEAGHRQIPPEALQGNPFIFRMPSVAPAGEGKNYNTAGAATVPRSQDDMAAVRQLELQSVMMSDKRAAVIISNNLLTEGQTIQGWTVARIAPRHVKLTRKDKTYVLEMPQ